MPDLDALLACAGTWRGTSRLHDPHTGKPDDSPLMACRGKTGDEKTGGTISVRGAYAAPPGPDRGWRNDIIASADGQRLRIVMYNVTPDGQVEEVAVEAEYARA